MTQWEKKHRTLLVFEIGSPTAVYSERMNRLMMCVGGYNIKVDTALSYNSTICQINPGVISAYLKGMQIYNSVDGEPPLGDDMFLYAGGADARALAKREGYDMLVVVSDPNETPGITEEQQVAMAAALANLLEEPK